MVEIPLQRVNLIIAEFSCLKTKFRSEFFKNSTLNCKFLNGEVEKHQIKLPSMPSISFSFFNSYRNFADENGIIQEFSTRIPLRKQLISDLVGQLGSYHACSSF